MYYNLTIMFQFISRNCTIETNTADILVLFQGRIRALTDQDSNLRKSGRYPITRMPEISRWRRGNF